MTADKIRAVFEINERAEHAMPKPAPQKLWWLSYANDEGFRGVVITYSSDFLTACMRSRMLGVSPGGQVRGFELPPEAESEIAAQDLDRCLNQEETKKYT
jgi:hypothetical protein